jgi:cellulose synthase/poly-beta-1,6-N-acetylglucosamine synthase-like glycosyltransferase
MIAETAFWVCVAALFHSYVFYPVLLHFLTGNQELHHSAYNEEDKLPPVKIFMSVYNEEDVIRQKLDSLLATTYPLDQLLICIGSDGSSDDTDRILQDYADHHHCIYFQRYSGRKGKANILNDLVANASTDQDEVYIFTDANVMFTQSTIFELVKYFKDASIGLVGANVINREIKEDGISHQEQAYIQRENYVKHLEGLCWGTMMGAFGACYAIRSSHFKPIPANFLMEDFYITMNVLKQGKKAINNLDAICYEDVANDLTEEFKRKVRISAGNFQNLSVYYSLLWPPFNGLAFSFLSHKVLRWLGPFFLIIALITSGYLAPGNIFYTVLFFLQGIPLLFPLLDHLLRKGQFHSLILRFIAYFYSMNLALLIGFFKYLKGVKTNVWQPTKRYEH